MSNKPLVKYRQTIIQTRVLFLM